ncbi:unnamed protein product [Rotaria magnacalcarata]|uniref:Riboflavin transporter n=2 Tax=Rotaria magnacalcarata TaxID=392030 RepID=A0A815VDN8_9BILA|nr:unnamed protein product [Rotaria magnacalcarata]CAF2101111.1 unnamed protein product [Rotaria magnacalcarata]CAF4807742.1 unnamed protein product [Rotaria magnacalcarata]
MNHRWNLNQYITYVLLTLFFLASWTDINGMFAELPQIILTQPESWKLGANLALTTNLGNIAPFTLVLIKFFYRKHEFNPVPINYVVIGIGMLSCLLLTFFWSYTTIVVNQRRSTALLILAFSLSLLDCTSSISFADYIHRFRKEYINTIFLGESFAFILPSLLAIAQGNGRLHCIEAINGTNKTEAIYQSPRFSVSIYFLCLFIILTISLISFILLRWTSITRYAYHTESETSLETIDTIYSQPKSLTTPSYILLSLLCSYISSVVFGFLLAISTYVLMPYGHKIFYLGTIISPWMLVLVWILGMIKPVLRQRYVYILITLGSITFAFSMYVALKSPCPPWVDTTKGSVLILFVWFITYILLGYPRLVIANYARRHSPNGMFWFGVQVQCGSLMGSITSYLMVEKFALFHERKPCEHIAC